jgi:NADPH:quinone reductase-like Zn-dependent oxidoreductase
MVMKQVIVITGSVPSECISIRRMTEVKWSHWVDSQPLAEVRAATSDLLTMLSNGALTPPAIGRYSFKDFQEAVRLADGEGGQQKVLLDFSERAP